MNREKIRFKIKFGKRLKKRMRSQTKAISGSLFTRGQKIPHLPAAYLKSTSNYTVLLSFPFLKRLRFVNKDMIVYTARTLRCHKVCSQQHFREKPTSNHATPLQATWLGCGSYFLKCLTWRLIDIHLSQNPCRRLIDDRSFLQISLIRVGEEICTRMKYFPCPFYRSSDRLYGFCIGGGTFSCDTLLGVVPDIRCAISCV